MDDAPAVASAHVPSVDLDAARREARAGDHAALTDRLVAFGTTTRHLARAESSHAALDVLWPLAEGLVADASTLDLGADVSVDTLALVLVRRAGVAVEPADLDRWRPIAAPRIAPAATDPVAETAARGAQTRRSLLHAGARTPEQLAGELDRVYDELAAALVARDEAEERAMALAGARELADRLAGELERDEWIRARVRKVKGTPVAKAAIKARRAVRDRG
jgi:hypothetical protein